MVNADWVIAGKCHRNSVGEIGGGKSRRGCLGDLVLAENNPMGDIQQPITI
jgi:hypothetical protein